MKDELLSRMIRIYGFESEETLAFARLLETDMPDEMLIAIVKAHEEYPNWLYDEEED